jgi:hypothetical protein
VQVDGTLPKAPDSDRLLVLLRPYMGQPAAIKEIDVEALPSPGGDGGAS